MKEPICDITTRDLAGRTILEVGSGRGDTTRLLARIINGKRTHLIVTDLSDAHFASLRKELEGIDIRFICTDVRQLNGIEENSIDYLVCNYTLCAIEAEAGGALQALGRFHEVLKPGGELFIEEEFPIGAANSPAQMVWAEKWRILKAALLIVGELPFHEFTPEVLVDSCNTAGFSKIEWEKNTNLLPGQDALDFFHVRLERLMGRFPNQALRMGFREWADALDERAKVAGGMEIPFYRLHAYKENG